MTGQASGVGVAGSGAQTAVGLTAAASAAAVRAGIAGFAQHPQLVDKVGEPLIVARVPVMDVDTRGIHRFLGLMLPAAQEAVAPLSGWIGKIPSIHVVIGLPGERPGIPKAFGAEIAEQFKNSMKDLCPISPVETLSAGHSAGLMAIEVGLQKIRGGAAEFCLVGGVDSYLEPATLEWLEKSDQLHGAGHLNNAWGFIPGEAAGFCLLCGQAIAEKFKLAVLGQLTAVATAREKNLIKTDTVCLGQGLTEAFRQVFQVLPFGVMVDHVICDMNGEAYRADEYGFTIMRTGQHFVSGGNFIAPADCWGDVGAASGPLFVGLAVAAGRKGYAKGPHTLLWTSSETGERCAALIRVDGQKGNR